MVGRFRLGSRSGAETQTVQARLDQHPEKMTMRRQTAEHPFGTIKGQNIGRKSQGSTLIALNYYGRDVTNIPCEASIRFNCQIALSAVAVLLACSICRRSALSEGSLSLIVHRHTNTLASWKLAIRTLCLTPGKWASKEFVCGRDTSPALSNQNLWRRYYRERRRSVGTRISAI